MFVKELQIASRKIGAGQSPFIIAEAGVNHNGDLKLAYKLIDEAKSAGADAVKFQSFSAKRLVSPATPKVAYQKSTTDQSETHYAMIKKLEISNAFQRKLFNYCRKRGILFLSTPYDLESAKFLNRLGVSAFKLASADIVDLPLHEYVAATGKPAIVSVGMATLSEIEAVLNIYARHKNPRVILLHCVSNYPASKAGLNLRVINTLGDTFGILVGYSDHSTDSTAAVVAAALGASMFEKHFTLDNRMDGPDHKASAIPAEFKNYVRAVRDVALVLGDPVKKIQPEEQSMRQISRKSLVAIRDIPKGAFVSKKMLTLKRPGLGIPYSRIEFVTGRRTRKLIKKDELILYKHFI